MSLYSGRRMVEGACVGLLLLAGATSLAHAQDRSAAGKKTGTAAAVADSATGESKPAKERAKPRGRLPAYYADVVTREQKEKIYDVQQKFAEQIQQLQADLQKLEMQRDAEVAAVLTETQQQQVAERIAAARAKRKTSGPAASDGAADSAEASAAP